MIPAKIRRTIEALLEQHPTNTPLVFDERLPDGTFYATFNPDGPILKGSTRMINWARDIRNNAFVPEIYSDEATTWA